MYIIFDSMNTCVNYAPELHKFRYGIYTHYARLFVYMYVVVTKT